MSRDLPRDAERLSEDLEKLTEAVNGVRNAIVWANRVSTISHYGTDSLLKLVARAMEEGALNEQRVFGARVEAEKILNDWLREEGRT